MVWGSVLVYLNAVCEPTCICLCVFICMYIMFVHICISMCMHVGMYIYICVSAYVGENVSMWYLVSMRISIIIGIFYSDSEKCCKTDKMIT